MEVYVNDMLVKSIRVSDHISDLGETFSILRKYCMKLNQAKCTFSVESANFTAPDCGHGRINLEISSSSMSSPIVPPAPSLLEDTGAEVRSDRWTLFLDGSSNSKRGGEGIILVAPNMTTIQYAIRLGFKASNNEAEYEALLAGLRLAISLGVQFIDVRCDSQLVVNQVLVEYEAKEERMIAYLDETRKIMRKFKDCIMSQIPRVENSWADALAKLASVIKGNIPRIVSTEFVDKPSIGQANQETINPMQVTTSWMNPIFKYLTSREVPQDRLEARRLRVRATLYMIMGDTSYKKGTLSRTLDVSNQMKQNT
ncbi:uncharacterized protein LOC131247143 [Magnolia sinica]|uniref:uncharacterized protein LOC131247143 n=1 Tax=Magnolia sinica TaxID=86752 RepID=UPI0026591D94|nr:uncharacterized protein LOC131247143 [Magnolia sinica]